MTSEPSASRALEVACAAARAGGAIVATCFEQGVAMREKAGAGLVSRADTESEEAVAAEIRRHFPEHAILGEELHRADVEAEHLWIVDPLDGTTNFAHGIPHFAVSIAYVHRGRTECGVVYEPVRGTWYTACRGAGARHDGRPVAVRDSRALDEVLVGLGFYYDRGARMEATLAAARDLFGHGVHGIRRFGAAALDLCAVGTGQFGAFFEYELAPWDSAAGALFVAEAGGRVTDGAGAPLPLRPGPVVASNGHLHEAVLAIVGANAP